MDSVSLEQWWPLCDTHATAGCLLSLKVPQGSLSLALEGAVPPQTMLGISLGRMGCLCTRECMHTRVCM